MTPVAFPILDRLVGPRRILAVLLVGGLLFLPFIGSFGLWDPHEVRIADLAKETLSGAHSKAALSRPSAPLWLVSSGFRVLGTGELGGRLPIALAALATLAACLYAGNGFVRRRGALLGAFMLATMPAFFLGARQLTTNVVPILAMTLAVGGLGRAVWTNDGDRRWQWLHLLLGVAGLALGQFSSGMILGVIVPLATVAIALAVSGGSRWNAIVLGVLALAAIAVAVAVHQGLGKAGRPMGYSWILGGVPRASMHSINIVSVLKEIGFGAAPWVILLPLGAVRALSPSEDSPRERYGRLLLLVWAVVGYTGATMHEASVGDVLFPGLAALALLGADYLDAAIDDENRLGYAGLIIAVAAAVIAHDFFLQPEMFGGAHVQEGVKWPGPMVVEPFILLGLLILWGLVTGLGLMLKPSATPGLFAGRQGVLAIGLSIALLQAGFGVFWVVPEMSKHLSYKNLFTKFKKLGGGEMAQFHVPGHTAWHNEGKTTDLNSLGEVFEFLARPGRVFVMVSADDLAPIDQYAKSAPGRVYNVIDDTNSHFLLLSNQVGQGEKDLNPLRRLIVDQLPRRPQHELHADFEGKAELIGYDLPNELERGREFKITLYYKVNAPLHGAYKVFVHFDGPGNRFNGDHVPLDGKFPTNYWVPGYYIIDEHRMEPDRTTVTPGYYQIYTGFWQGDQRLKAATGNNDGENRVKIGSVRVK